MAKTLESQGFKIATIGQGENLIYSIKYALNKHPIIAFSKVYDVDFNPESQFAAVMTCSKADDACPFIADAENRIPITFNDPKSL